ncbi:hypothetical protein P3551_22975 [Vibrio parahaemolyticus]|uniref:hypothetical protein n=1 Tax=Vibrio parahaemolyticus TaxID=670 RepID=UPI00111D46D0|nr:hypothetical protein [Vibrio parahaemolyticus]MBE3985590.1 hypothetical protein [Vibrio parahaemolyticus]MBE4286489.1 hypothetical protein [Vibrio parahaemolyticus]MDF4902149.1 hypothetical protein [Vibrio parahaemolyticus]TOH19125.1 hypothetical protein CGI90_03870 [Vibrio parahaemolyticus]HCG7330532.1 hypothetical protein [Vibrio parahaemolyticus]
MPSSIMITASREAALEQVEKYLRCSDQDALLKTKCGEFHSLNKTFVRWLGAWQNIASEFRIDKADREYQELTGHVCVVSCIGQNHECRIAGFSSLAMALVWAGLRLTRNSGAKASFKRRHASLISELYQ